MSNFYNAQERLDHNRSPKTQKHYSKLLNDKQFSNVEDDSQYSPWNAHKDSIKGTITRFDATGLEIMSMLEQNTFSKENPPTLETVKLFQEFLENSLGNMELNQFIRSNLYTFSNLHSQAQEFLVTNSGLNNVAYLTFKTRNLNRVEQVVDKVEKIYNALENDIQLNEQEKLTLKEFGAVIDLGKISDTFETFYQQGMLESNTKLLNLYEQSKNANKVLQKFNKITSHNLKHEKTDIFLVNNINKFHRINDSVLDFMAKLETFFTKHWYGGLLTNIKNNSTTLINNKKGSVVHNILSLSKTVTIDKYKIDPIALVSADKYEILQQTYGNNWKAEVTAKFHETSKRLQSAKFIKNYSSVMASFEKKNEGKLQLQI